MIYNIEIKKISEPIDTAPSIAPSAKKTAEKKNSTMAPGRKYLLFSLISLNARTG